MVNKKQTFRRQQTTVYAAQRLICHVQTVDMSWRNLFSKSNLYVQEVASGCVTMTESGLLDYFRSQGRHAGMPSRQNWN